MLDADEIRDENFTHRRYIPPSGVLKLKELELPDYVVVYERQVDLEKLGTVRPLLEGVVYRLWYRENDFNPNSSRWEEKEWTYYCIHKRDLKQLVSGWTKQFRGALEDPRRFSFAVNEPRYKIESSLVEV